MKKLILFTAIALIGIKANSNPRVAGVKPLSLPLNTSSIAFKNFKTAATYFDNSSNAWATITLTSTSGGSNYTFTIPPKTKVTSNVIDDGVYNIQISGSGPNSLGVFRCDNQLYGYSVPTPYTYTGYSTASSGQLIIILVP
ncbi:hypothetical protein [Pedobacter nototheniae]|uniref:hypothetical protein n=1 Tax=Pedobacter nototheniae TaxID=2488994 RepID=UPI0029314524|nr:hypothetical protein [Pedobacter nototheniae]